MMSFDIENEFGTKFESSGYVGGAKCEDMQISEFTPCDSSGPILDMTQRMASARTNGVYVDLKSKGITEIPTSFFDMFRNVKYLYLEGNRLQELSDSFFPSLLHIKWLDIRNNELSFIPQSIGGHQTLETLLLQGNKIKVLPLELGMVPKLRGLQLQGNPIAYPTQEVISKGVKYLLQFLRDELESKSLSNVQPVSELYYQNTKPTEMSEKKRTRQEASKSCTNTSHREKTLQFPQQVLELKDSQMSCIGNRKPLYSNDKAGPQSLKISLQHTPEANDFVSQNDTQLPGGDGLSIEEKILQYQLSKHQPTPYEKKQINRDALIQENFMKEMWICKLKDMLEQQGKILQRRKDEEILKAWRQEYKKRQSIPRSHKFEMSIPYDTNPHLVFDGTEIPQPKQAVEIVRDIGIEMAEIFQTLQSISASKAEAHLSPISKQMALDTELKTLAQLQQKLSIIKTRNNSEYQKLGEPEKSLYSQTRKSAPNRHSYSLLGKSDPVGPQAFGTRSKFKSNRS